MPSDTRVAVDDTCNEMMLCANRVMPMVGGVALKGTNT